MQNKFNLPLVNAHTHAAMVYFRGRAGDVPLDVWLEKYIRPEQEKKVTAAFVYENTKKAIGEMKNNGIGAFADMYFFQDEAARAASEAGMHVLLGVDIGGFVDSDRKLKRNEFSDYLEKYRRDEKVKVALTVPSFGRMTEDYLSFIAELAERYGIPVHLHMAETEKEAADCRRRTGLSPVEYADRLGLLGNKTLLAHCVWVSDRDIGIIRARRCHVVHCPLSNLKLGSGIAPVAKMIAAGINVCLGTDSAASSDRLDIWEAGKFAVLAQRGMTRDPAGITAKDAFKMMTVNGMKALGFEEIGGMTMAEVAKTVDEYENHDILYSLNISEIITRRS